MPRDVYFWQSGSIPGLGAFSGGQVITVSDDGRTVLAITPLAVPPSPLAVSSPAASPSDAHQPSSTATATPDGEATPLQSSSSQSAPSTPGDATILYVNGG